MTQRNVAQRSTGPIPRLASAHLDADRSLALLAGATTAGAGASLPFTYIYLARPQEPQWSHLAVVFGGLFLAGALYSVLVAAVRGRRLRARAVGGVGAALLGATVAGLVAGFVAEPGLAGLPLPVVFAVVFPPIVGGVVLLYTYTLGRALHIRTPGRYALAAALVGTTVALGVVLATDPLPGWRVGSGDRAMIKAGWLGTLLGGAAAGALYMALAGRRHTVAEAGLDNRA